MVEWTPVEIDHPVALCEVSETSPDPLDQYKERYVNSLSEDTKANFDRYDREIFSQFCPGASVLLFGSGHSYHANTTLHRCPNVDKVTVLDYVEEAGLGLVDGIDFICEDIRNTTPPPADYVFSAHTVEHLSRADIMYNVLPKLLRASRKALVIVVPYGDNWGLEPSHLCRFYDNDEFIAQALRYKRILDNPMHNAYGQELVLWFKGENGG